MKTIKHAKTEVHPSVPFEGFFAFWMGILIVGGPPILMLYFDYWPEHALLAAIILGFSHIASHISRWTSASNAQILQLEQKVVELAGMRKQTNID